MVIEFLLTKVGEIANSISDTHDLGKERLIFLNTSDILLGRILHNSYSAVEYWPGQAKKSVKKDDILFSEIRPANGRWAYINNDADDVVVSTKLMVIRARKEKVLPKFLYHFLTSNETTQWLQHLAESRSGTFPQITFNQVAALEIALPPLSLQSEIAAFFDVIENKIELNRQMNKTLEYMARAIFKSWFVGFDPVQAKVEGRSPSGISAEVANLFADAFEDSDVGAIPKGWRSSKVGDEFRLTMGQSPPGSTYNEEGIGLPFFQGRTDFGTSTHWP